MALKTFLEQRASERVDLMFHTQIIDCATERSIGVLCDISVHGLRIIGDKGVSPGKKLRLRVVLPVEGSEAKDLVLFCQSRWSHRDSAVDCFYIGFQVLEVADDQKLLLESLIEEYGFGDMLKN